VPAAVAEHLLAVLDDLVRQPAGQFLQVIEAPVEAADADASASAAR
jgi:hypothetical protein